MPRIPNIYPALYNAKLKSLMRYAKRLEKQGFIVDYSTFPKALKKPNLYNWERIESWTYEDVRLRATMQSNGESISYSKYAHKKRSQASKKGWQTRRINIQSFEEFFDIENVPRRLPPAREAKLPKNIQWSEDFQSYGDFATGELISDIDSYISSIPDQQPIVMKNYLEEVGEQILPSDFFNELLELLEGNIEDTNSWYSRKAKSRIKSTHLMNRLAEKIHGMIRDKKSNKTYYRNIIEAGQKDQLMTAIEKVIYGYDESEISLGYSTALRILSGKDYALSAAEYSEADEEFE